jgi:hypothetical protein
MRLPKYDHVVETFPSERADESLRVPILKGSQLHLVHMMERSLSGSPMFFIHGTGISSHCWTGAAPGKYPFTSLLGGARYENKPTGCGGSAY